MPKSLSCWLYELCVADRHDPREVAKWVTGELTRLMREHPLSIEPGELSAIFSLLTAKKLTLMQAREVFEQSFIEGRSVSSVFEEKAFGGPQTEDWRGDAWSERPHRKWSRTFGAASSEHAGADRAGDEAPSGSVKPDDASRVLSERWNRR